ncbi:MAG: hypothetical protein P4L40_02625 [Terracidiphilus sp.]|nr:hypothetical protein [Terracidiphilus sp.]
MPLCGDRVARVRTHLQKWKQALMLQHEAQSSDSLSQLRAAQEALVSLKQQFDARLADVISEKEREAQAALATLQSQLTALDAKYTRSQEVGKGMSLFPLWMLA